MTTTSVKLAWSDAHGPVAGYSVYVQRDGAGAFKHELDVTAPTVTLNGAPGSTARVTVVAFDSARAHGPNSPTSPLFTFPGLENSSTASSQAASAESVGASLASVSGGSAASDPVADPPPDSSEEPVPALPGTLAWQAGDAFRVTDSELVTTRMFARPQEGAQLAGMGDFDADGIGDLLWVVGATAQLGYTPGSALRTSSDAISLVDLGALAAEERVLGAGDLDGDGDGDVLVASGDAVRARLTTGAAPAVSELGTASAAVLAGIADFDGNRSEDVAWRSSTGALVLWLMDGGSLAATVEVVVEGALEPIGVGDFDGDGSAELALRNPAGDVYVVHPLAAVPQLEATALSNMQWWQPVGVADLDGDRSEELVLAMGGAIRIAGATGDHVTTLEPGSPWQLVALLP